MKLPTISTSTCTLPGGSTGGNVGVSCPPLSDGDPRCVDLEWAADHPDLCPGAPTITGLRVNPEEGTIDLGSLYPFRAYLTFSNGQERDVTEKADWATNNSNIADVDETGQALGTGQGVATISAGYRGFFDFSQLTVTAECISVGFDVVLVFDRSGSMSALGNNGVDRLKMAKQAAKSFVRNAKFTKDRIAVVSFAGVFEPHPSGPPTTAPNTTLHTVLSPIPSDIEAAIDSIQIGEQSCYYMLPNGLEATRCATGIGGGLQVAYDELHSDRIRAGTRKVIVLLTDGMENICKPDPYSVSDQFKIENGTIVVIALAVEDGPGGACGNFQAGTIYQYMAGISSCDLFFPAKDPDELADIYARVPSIVCYGNYNPCFYYMVPPEVVPPPLGCYRDKLNYTAFANWRVHGFVDLIGYDLFPLFPPSAGHGLYVDLVGSILPGTGDHVLGKITSKTSFPLSGRYRLSLKLAGNKREPMANFSVRIRVGNHLNKVVTINNWQQPFQEYSWDFNANGNASIEIEHLPLPEDSAKIYGILLDDVKLTSLDTNEVLLEDNFNTENPCPP